MELIRHITWKPWEEKNHKLWSNTQNQKTRLKAPKRVVEKNFSGPHIWYICLLSWSYDLQLSSYQKIFRTKWNGDNWTIQNITWLANERCTLSVQNVSWNTGDLDEITGSIINQSIIRCNYIDKFSYWNLKDNAWKEIEIKMHIYMMLQYHNYPKEVRRNISSG